MEFMGITVSMLKEWNYYLELLYGNWREQGIGGTKHGELIFDADHPYTDYFICEGGDRHGRIK